MKAVKTLKCKGVQTKQKINLMVSTLSSSGTFYLFVWGFRFFSVSFCLFVALLGSFLLLCFV